MISDLDASNRGETKNPQNSSSNSTNSNNWSRWDWVKYLATIAIVLAIGLFALNQFMGFVFKAQFLNSPCQLCLDLNHDFVLSKKVELSNITSNILNLTFPK